MFHSPIPSSIRSFYSPRLACSRPAVGTILCIIYRSLPPLCMNSYLVLSTSFDQLLYKQPPETRTNVLFYFEERGRYATLAAHTLGVFNPNYVMPHRRHSRARGLELHLPISKLS